MELITLLGTAMGLGFVSGINLYATILTIGFGLQLGLIHLAPEMAALSDLAHPLVLTAATAAYLAEFFADKVPWVDTLWDTIHTLIRPIAAAVIGVKAIGAADPAMELAVILLCGGVALSTHTTKAGMRFLVNQSPEPFSNIALSLGEDVVAAGGAMLAMAYPGFMLAVAVGFMGAFLLLFPMMFRLLKAEILAVGYRLFQKDPAGPSAGHLLLFDDLPEQMMARLYGSAGGKPLFCVKGISGKGLPVSRNRVGYLCLSGDRLIFLTRKHFRVVDVEIARKGECAAALLPKLLFDRLLVISPGGRQSQILLFKRIKGRGENVLNMLTGRQWAQSALEAGEQTMIPRIEGGQ